MNRVFASLLLCCGAAFAQSDAAPKFTVADIHFSPPASIPAEKGPFFGDGRYEIYYATMVDLIHEAYNVDADRVYGGPSWLEYDRYDVMAMAPPNSTAASRRQMLQSLLTDRFGVEVHNDSKPMTAYRLTAGKSPKLQESTATGGCSLKIENLPPNGPPPAPGEGRPAIRIPVIVYTCQGASMVTLAETLANAPGANQYFDNKPVVDQTDLKGAYDFTLRYTPKIPANIAVQGENIPLPDAVEKQLGLKLELATAPAPVVVVDAAVEKPSPNPPDVAKSFPPTPTEFDAAEIKPSDSSPGRQGAQPEIKNGRVILPGIDLKSLVLIAWNFAPNDDEALVGAPKWVNSARYDIIAKAPPGVALGDLTPSSNKRFPVNLDALRPMLQNLLIEKFKIKAHTEDRPTSAYTLLAVKPKMQKADPTERTKWTNGPSPDQRGKNSNSALGRLVICQNMTMTQFARLLQEIAPGYIHTGVLDQTGMEGGYDFTLNFSTVGQVQGGGRGRGDGAAASAGPAEADASEPTGALSLPDAIAKQLGLKLDMQKRPLPVLVIDHIDEKISDN